MKVFCFFFSKKKCFLCPSFRICLTHFANTRAAGVSGQRGNHMSISSISSVASAVAAAQLGQQAAPDGPATGGGSAVQGKDRHQHADTASPQIGTVSSPGGSAAGTSGSAVNQVA
jgi:hypothetical protein